RPCSLKPSSRKARSLRRWRMSRLQLTSRCRSRNRLHVSLQEKHGWHFARPKSATRWLLCVCAFFLAVGSASAANPLTVWKERLFGRDGAEPVVRDAPDEGVVVLGLNRPERIHVDTRNGSRKFPKGESHFR